MLKHCLLALVLGYLPVNVALADSINEATADVSGPVLDFMIPQGSPYYMNAVLVAETLKNSGGGIADGSAHGTVSQVGFALNSSAIGLPEGGRFRVSVIKITSQLPSARLIGDSQVASNIEATPDTRVYDAWYRQDFHSMPLRLRVGIIDVNEYFNVTDSASTLLNSSFGIGAGLSANAPFSIYPRPGYGLTARYGQDAQKFLVGVFNGNPEARDNLFNAGQLSIAEWQQDAGKSIHIKLGGWHCNCLTAASIAKQSTQGFYGGIEKHFTTGDNKRATVFVRGAVSHGVNTIAPDSVAFGVLYPSLLASRPEDFLSAGVARARFLDGSDETSYELTYVWQVNSSLSLQPDVQYIASPSGNLPNTWVMLLRLNMFYDTHFD